MVLEPKLNRDCTSNQFPLSNHMASRKIPFLMSYPMSIHRHHGSSACYQVFWFERNGLSCWSGYLGPATMSVITAFPDGDAIWHDLGMRAATECRLHPLI